MGPEAKFYKYFKKNTPNISYTRIENTSALGTPDVLAYNKNNTFFTIGELGSLSLAAWSLMLAAWGLTLAA